MYDLETEKVVQYLDFCRRKTSGTRLGLGELFTVEDLTEKAIFGKQEVEQNIRMFCEYMKQANEERNVPRQGLVRCEHSGIH